MNHDIHYLNEEIHSEIVLYMIEVERNIHCLCFRVMSFDGVL